MNFKGFYGNKRAKEYLNSAFAHNSLPHALLIVGERGIGKKTLANIIANALVCNDSDAPCYKCDACYKVKNASHPDIRFLGNDETSVKVNEIRELKHDALLRPNDADRKVYIINNAGAMTDDAQDALLKILEEPPAFTFFILLCYNYSDLLPTIVSRTAHISLSPLSDSDMQRVISEKLPDLTSSQTDELIMTSGGVCSFLQGEHDNETLDFAVNCIKALISLDELEIFLAFSSLEKIGKEKFNIVLNELIRIMRDSIIFSLDCESRLISHVSSKLIGDFSKLYSPKLSTFLINHLSDAKSNLSKNIGLPHITGSLTCKFANIAVLAASKG